MTDTTTGDDSDRIDAALGLRMVSIRLPVQLVDDFKLLAGKGPYQALMRQTLTNYAADALIAAGREFLSTQEPTP